MGKNVLMTLANGVKITWYREEDTNIVQINGKYGEIKIKLDTLEVIDTNNGFICEEEYTNFVINSKSMIQSLIRDIQRKQTTDDFKQSLVLKLMRKLDSLKVLKWPDEVLEMNTLRKEYNGCIKIDGPIYEIVSTEYNVAMGTPTGDVRADILVTTTKGKKIALMIHLEEDDIAIRKLISIGINTLKISKSNIDKLKFDLVYPINMKDLIYKLETYAT